MYIWLIKLLENADNYERRAAFQGFVVVSDTETKARNLCKRWAADNNSEDWSKKAKQASAVCVGETLSEWRDGDIGGVILADFIDEA